MPAFVRSTAGLVVWTAGLLITARLILHAGSDDLRIPLTSLTDFRSWLADAPPPTMAMAVIRLAALVAVAYLLAATALAVAANLIRAKPLEAAAQRLTPTVVRRLATGGGGVGLALGSALGAVPVPGVSPHAIIASAPSSAPTPDATPPTTPPVVATMTRHDTDVATMTRSPTPIPPPATPAPSQPPTGQPPLPEPWAQRDLARRGPGPIPTSTEVSSNPDDRGPGATPIPIDPTPGPPATTPGPRPAPAEAAPHPAEASRGPRPAHVNRAPRPVGPSGAASPGQVPGPAGMPGPSPPAADELPPITATMTRNDGVPPPPLPAPGDTWVVTSGDSFWSIAEELVAGGGASPPSERDVGRYWRRLIDANRSELVDPGNPDLLVPGQELVVPPP